MVLHRKIKRTMLESKSQYLGSLVLIIISCLLFTMLNLLSINMADMTASFEKNYVQEDASFVTGSRLNNIDELESKFNVSIEDGATFDSSYSKGKTLRIFSENIKVNVPAIIEGSSLSDNGILIDPAFAKANNLKIGSMINILDKKFKVDGFMSLPNYIYPLKSENDIISDANSFGIAVISKDNFSRFGRGNSFYSIKFNSGRNSLDMQASQFRDYLKSSNIIVSQWLDINDNKRVSFVTTKIQGISKISSSAPVAILLLTCIMTGIVIWRLLKRESVIIGTLYSQGYRRREIRRHYMMYPLVIALTGGIIGTVLGAILLKPMLDLMVSYFNMPINSMDFNPVYLLVSILLPVLFLSASGYYVLGRELRYSPVELMKGGREKSKVNFIERKFTLERLKFTTKFKVREQLRSLSRLIFLLLGVVLATMLLLFGFTAKSSMDYLMKEGLRNSFKFEYEYVYNSLHLEQPPSNTETFSAATFDMKSDKKYDFRIVGINPSSKYISLKGKNGTQLNTDRVIITKPLAEKFKVSPGDKVQVINKLDSREYAVTIDSVAETYMGEYIFMPLVKFNDMLGLPAGSYMGLWSKGKQDIPEKSLYSVQSIEESAKAFEASTQPLQATIGIISLMSFIIGLVVIYVVTSLIIEENKGNISLMKVFGYRRKEVNSLILNSSTAVIVVGYLIGIPLVMAFMRAMFQSLAESVKMTMPVRISYPYIIVGFVVVYVMFLLTKALSRKKVDRISMSEALKSGVE